MTTSVRNKLVLLFTISIVMIVVFGLAINQKQQAVVVESNNRTFPEFTLQALSLPVGDAAVIDEPETLTKKAITLHTYQLVNVWASWCGICKSEHSTLMQLASNGVPIIGLNYRDTPAAAITELQSAGNPYRKVISDPNGQLALDLGVVGTPETYLVDQKGKVIKKVMGVITLEVWQKEFADYFTRKATL